MARLATSDNRLLHPREALVATGSLGSLGAEIIVAADGSSSVALDLRGTFNLTVEVAGSVDGVNWIVIPVKAVAAAGKAYASAVAGSTQGVWVGACSPYRLVRARCSAYTSGAAVVTLCAEAAPLDQSLDGMVTTHVVTGTAAAGAALTLTMPSPGAGLRAYLTYLRIGRFAAAALTAGAAPVVVTTTNLPGSVAFSIPADASPAGELFAYQEDFAYPIAAAAMATATTIVCPATTGVIWRATAGYYIAP